MQPPTLEILPDDTWSSYVKPTTPRSQNNFGNLPFSYAITANYYLVDVQRAQVQTMHVPTWAMATLNDLSSSDPFELAFMSLRERIQRGQDVQDLCGWHPYIDALDSEAAYNRAPPLSQTVACIVESVKLDDPDPATRYAMMWWFWMLLRWMLNPSPDTYEAMAPPLRPKPVQLFQPHLRIVDFVVAPAMRELMCQHNSPGYRWLSEACITVRFEWP